MKRTDQLSHENRKGTYSKWAKNQVNRAIRRAEKLDPENAPLKKAYYGWA